jgi:hypothetical protein
LRKAARAPPAGASAAAMILPLKEWVKIKAVKQAISQLKPPSIARWLELNDFCA